MTISSITCFCGHREGNKPDFLAGARLLGAAMAKRRLQLIYGGGGAGMMGALAGAVLDNGGSVTGVIPHGLASAEFAHPRLSAMHKVDTMHERKALMEKLGHAFIALPGGFGTLDELFEIATWSQIGLHTKPVGLLDTNGYWEGLQLQVSRAIADGFVPKELGALMVIDRDPERLIERLLAHAPPPPVVRWQAAR
ncbi:MAG: TIGR00730 family Rossman fold protein [Myxococcaceae bacterium]|nr:TIGR00730 family Rossman fold protein [Myxococcaceae bacterium]